MRKNSLVNNKGQALVEFVIVIFPLITLLTAIIFMADVYLLKFRTVVGARYATWRMANIKADKRPVVESDVKKYFFPANSIVELENVEESENGGDDGWVNSVMDFAGGVFVDPEENPPLRARYSVTYIKQLNNLPEGFPDNLRISSKFEVDGNCWDGDNTGVHEMFKLIISGIEGFFDGIESFLPSE